MGTFSHGYPTWDPSQIGTLTQDPPHGPRHAWDPSHIWDLSHVILPKWDLAHTWDPLVWEPSHPGSLTWDPSQKRGSSPTGLLLTWDLILTWDLNGIIARELPHVGPSKHGILTLNPVYESRTQLLNSTQLNSTQLNSTPCARSTEGVIPPLVEASATRGTLSLVSQAAVGGTLG